MLQIDSYAYANRLSSVHPAEKAAFSAVTTIVCLASPSAAAPAAAILIMAGAAVIKAGIPPGAYLRLLAVPALFLATGSAAVALSVSGQAGGYLFGFALGGAFVGVTPGDAALAARLFVKSLGATSCLIFLSLTTPMVEIISTLRKAGAPALFVELAALVYRFIFVLAETAGRIYTSQSSRLGYRSLKSGYQSAGQLAGNLLIRSCQRSQALYTALSARCYSGEIRVLDREYPVSARNIAVIAVLDLLLAALNLAGRVPG